MSYFFLISLILCISRFSCIVLNTPLGDISGKDLNGMFEFMGIPYAEPPIGNLRFAPAVPVTSFNGHSGTYDASTGYKNACIQPPGFVDPTLVAGFSEDCLQLNIWTPTTDTNAKLPVIVYIHGGAFSFGVAVHGKNFVRKSGQQTVFVSINYRLGALGFYASTEISLTYGKGTGGMNGILDQITAIQWVKDNIENFGGDPEQITIGGTSSGGVSVCSLLVSRIISEQNLFDRAMIVAGPCTNSRWAPISMLQSFEQVSEASLYSGMPMDLASLRFLPANTLNNALLFGMGFFTIPWYPAVDGYVLEAHPDYLFPLISQGLAVLNAHQIKWGFTNFDSLASRFGTAFVLTDDNSRRTALQQYITDNSVIDEIINTYYPSSATVTQFIAWVQMESDLCVVCPTFNLAATIDDQTAKPNKGRSRRSSSKSHSSSYSSHGELESRQVEQYVYEFRGTAPTYLAPHAIETAFFLGNRNRTEGIINWDGDLSNRMIDSLRDFKTEGETDYEWNTFSKYKRFKSMSGRVFIWDDNNPRMSNRWLRRHNNMACQFWDTIDRDIKYNICNDGLSPITE